MSTTFSRHVMRMAERDPRFAILREAQAAEDQKIADLYERGFTTHEIADRRDVHVGEGGVRRALARVGVKMRPRGTRTARVISKAQLDHLRATGGTIPLVRNANHDRDAKAAPKPTPKATPVAEPAEPPVAGAARQKRRMAIQRVAPFAEAIIARYQGGESGNTLAKEYGVTPHSIYRLLARRGVSRRDKGAKTDAFYKAMKARRQHDGGEVVTASGAAARNAALIKARVEEGLTYGELSARFDVSRQRIGQILTRAGVTEGKGRGGSNKLPKVKATNGRNDTADLAAMVGFLTGKLDIVQSAVVAIANDLGIVVNPDGTIDRPGGDSVLAVHRHGTGTNGTGPVMEDPNDAEVTPAGAQDRHAALPQGWRYMTDAERLAAWAGRGGTPPANLVVRDEDNQLGVMYPATTGDRGFVSSFDGGKF